LLHLTAENDVVKASYLYLETRQSRLEVSVLRLWNCPGRRVTGRNDPYYSDLLLSYTPIADICSNIIIYIWS